LIRETLPKPPALTELTRAAEERSPELAEARQALERTRLTTELARRNLKPDFVASAAYMNRGGLPLMWSLGVGVSLPLWKKERQAPLIVEAQARERAAAAVETSIRTRLGARTEERLIRLEQLASEATLDAEGILVQDQLAVDSALASYRTGGVPFITVLEALSTLFIDRRAAVSRLADYLRTDADLYELALDGTGSAMTALAPAAPAASRM
jgi:outer membrane protein TolC